MALKTKKAWSGARLWLRVADLLSRRALRPAKKEILPDLAQTEILRALAIGGAAGAAALKNLEKTTNCSFRGFFPESRSFPVSESEMQDIFALAIEKTPLMLALLKRQQECVEFLLPRSDWMARDPNGITALFIAVNHAPQETIAELIPGSDVNAATIDGLTPLMMAALHGVWQAVALLAKDTRTDADKKQRKGSHAALSFAMTAREPRSIAPLAAVSSAKTREHAFNHTLELLRNTLDPLAMSDKWACLDELAPFVSKDQQRKAFALAGRAKAQRLPRLAAAMEAESLRAEIDNASVSQTLAGKKMDFSKSAVEPAVSATHPKSKGQCRL